jgi:hypothetical protein
LVRFEFEYGIVHFVFLLSLFHLENRVCLSRGVQVAGAAWRSVTRIVAGVGDLMQRTGDGRTGQVLGNRAIERSGGAVGGLHRACGDMERGFLGRALKPRSMVCEWFGLKTTRTVFLWFDLKSSGDGFLQFGLKTSGDDFSLFGLKTGGQFLG